MPGDYYYTKDHEWTKRKRDGNVLIGITDYAAKMLHDIVYVTLPREGQTLSKKEVLGQVESVKTVSDIYAPVSGTVVKSNDRLTKEPEIVSSSPYKDGWMLEIKSTNYDNEVKDLMNADSYRKFVSELGEKE
ncbi:MAG: glycine cleavage system protein GcvH [archaeon]|nr:glycine cleavage system protein GcvH [archaeon]